MRVCLFSLWLLFGLVSVSGTYVNSTLNPYAYFACADNGRIGGVAFIPIENSASSCSYPGPDALLVSVGVPVQLVLCDPAVVIGLSSVPGNGSMITEMGLSAVPDNTTMNYTEYGFNNQLFVESVISRCERPAVTDNPGKPISAVMASWKVPSKQQQLQPTLPPNGNSQYCCIVTYAASNNYSSNLYVQVLGNWQEATRLALASNVTAPTSLSSSSSSGPLPSSSSSSASSTSSSSSSTSSSGPSTSTSSSGATPTSTGSTGTTSSTNTNTGSFFSSSSGSSSRSSSSSSSTGTSTQSSTAPGANPATPSAGVGLPYAAALVLVTVVAFLTQ